MGFLSSHHPVGFSIQKTPVHMSWNKHHSFSICSSFSTALLDKTHLAECLGFAGSVGGPWSTGWAGALLPDSDPSPAAEQCDGLV